MNRAAARLRAILSEPTLLLTLGRSVGFAAAFLIPVVLTRVLDVPTFGTYKQLLLVYGVLFLVGQAGLSESLYYFVPQAPERAGRYAANAVLALGLAGAAAAAIAIGLRGAIAAWLNNAGLAPDLPLLAAFAALALLSAPLETVLVARHRYRGAAATYALSDVLRAALMTAPALLFGRLEAVLWGAVLFMAVRSIAMLVLLRAEFGSGFRPDAGLLRAQLGYALPFAAAVTIEAAQAGLHQAVVSWRTSAALFAVYSVGCLQVPFVDLVAGPAGNVMMVGMSDRLASGDRAALAALAGQWRSTVTRLAAFFVPLVALLLVVARDLILSLFPPAYAASAPVFRVWSLSILLAALPTDGVLRVFARTRLLLGVNAARLAVVAASILVGLRLFGLPGAALATVLGLLCAKTWMLLAIRRLLDLRPSGLLPWKSLGTTAGLAVAATGPALLARSSVDAPPAVRCLLAGLAFAAVWLAGVAGLEWMRTRGDREAGRRTLAGLPVLRG